MKTIIINLQVGQMVSVLNTNEAMIMAWEVVEELTRTTDMDLVLDSDGKNVLVKRVK